MRKTVKNLSVLLSYLFLTERELAAKFGSKDSYEKRIFDRYGAPWSGMDAGAVVFGERTESARIRAGRLIRQLEQAGAVELTLTRTMQKITNFRVHPEARAALEPLARSLRLKDLGAAVERLAKRILRAKFFKMIDAHAAKK